MRQRWTTDYLLSSGPLDLSDIRITGATFGLAGLGFSDFPDLTLRHSVVATDATLTTVGQSTIHVLGGFRNDGTISIIGFVHAGNNITHVLIGPDPSHPDMSGRLINRGSMVASLGSDLTIAGGVFRNDGTLQAGSHTRIDADVLGQGAMTFAAPTPVALVLSLIFAELELDRRVAAGQVIDMTNDATVRLGDLVEFHGMILGFSGPVAETVFNHVETHQDTIALLGVNATALDYRGDSSHGTLTVLSGATAIGSIAFVGDFTSARFVLSHGGSDSLIRLA